MNIRFFMLGTDKHSSAKRFEADIKQLFAEHLRDDGDVGSYDSIKDATGDIAKAVSDAHALVFIADTEIYGNTKQLLAKAFGFEMVCDGALLDKACTACEKDKTAEDYEFSLAHAFSVPNARTFVLGDGLYCGFSVASGNQTIILLPFAKGRTSILLTTQLIPYLNATYHISVDAGMLAKINSEKLRRTLEEKDVKVALASTNTANFFKEYISCDEALSERISISPINEKRGNLQPVDFVVNLSITVSEFLSCPYGVAMSNAFYTGDSPEGEKIVYLAVTNERETSVREVHSFAGEDVPSFLARCSGDLCVFITDVIANDTYYAQDNSVRENAAAKRYKIAIGAVSAVIVALCVFCFSYFGAHNYTISQWAENFMEWVFPAGNPFEGMFDKKQPLGEETVKDSGTEADGEGSTDSDNELTDSAAAEGSGEEDLHTQEASASGEATAESTQGGSEITSAEEVLTED